MSLKLTQKQEKFCVAYLNAKNASDAYREAYSAKKMSSKVINLAAYELLQNPKITLRIEELRAQAAKVAVLDVNDLISELEEARKIAVQDGQASAAVAATMGKAKLLGFGSESNLTINNIPMVLNIQPVKPMGRIDA